MRNSFLNDHVFIPAPFSLVLLITRPGPAILSAISFAHAFIVLTHTHTHNNHSSATASHQKKTHKNTIGLIVTSRPTRRQRSS